MRRLAEYRNPVPSRSRFELAVTVITFAALFALAWVALSVSPWISVGISLANAAFLVRLFMIQQDCGQGSFFRDRCWNDRVGRSIGALTLTPYCVWRRSHATHHATIPFYRLPEVLRDHDELTNARRLTLRESLHCATLALWDENGRRLVSFSQARRLRAEVYQTVT